jgi:hypothetical protein
MAAGRKVTQGRDDYFMTNVTKWRVLQMVRGDERKSRHNGA